MPNTSNQTLTASVVDILEDNTEKVNGLSEVNARRRQELVATTIPELELNAYIHCYGD